MSEEDFEKFWKIYPRRVAKLDARKAWRKLKGEDIEAVLQGVRTWIASGYWSDPQFIPYPATFINGHRWEDEVQLKSAEVIPIAQSWILCAPCGEEVTAAAYRKCEAGRCPWGRNRLVAGKVAL